MSMIRPLLDALESEHVRLKNENERLRDENVELRRGLKEAERSVDYWRHAYLAALNGVKEALADADYK